MDDFNLWPLPDYHLTDFASKPTTHEEIEDWFKALYPNTFPVLFSSARAGLSAILQVKGLKRNDHIFIPPFASHCVLNSVSWIATPNPEIHSKLIKAHIIFHQWGIPFYLKNRSNLIIEDSVDSVMTNSSSLFPNDGSFELLSLPKIFSSVTGGIVLCQKEEDSLQLKKIRNERKYFSWYHFLLRLNLFKSGYINHYWAFMDIQGGRLPLLALNEIKAKLDHWKKIIELRETNLLKYNNIVSKLNYKLNSSRLPSNLPFSSDKEIPELSSVYRSLIINQQLDDSLETAKYYTIPLHHQTNFEKLDKILGLYEI